MLRLAIRIFSFRSEEQKHNQPSIILKCQIYPRNRLLTKLFGNAVFITGMLSRYKTTFHARRFFPSVIPLPRVHIETLLLYRPFALVG